MKTEVYNLIIIDESGSMTCVKNSTISGCNETINSIKSTQKQLADSQDHFVSIYTFQSNGNKPSRYIVKNQPAESVNHITNEDYEPWGSTPLYDAVGSTLADLKAIIKNNPMATASITIITDGYENSSRHYTLPQIAKMIESLKEIGWNFNFIGANIDVERVAKSLNIDKENAMAFDQDEIGTEKMFDNFNKARHEYAVKESCCMKSMPMADLSPEEQQREIHRRRAEAAKGFFSKFRK